MNKMINNTQKFIENMKSTYGMTDKNVLQAVQEEPQHDFIMAMLNVDVEEATRIIEGTEEYLMSTIGNPFL